MLGDCEVGGSSLGSREEEEVVVVMVVVVEDLHLLDDALENHGRISNNLPPDRYERHALVAVGRVIGRKLLGHLEFFFREGVDLDRGVRNL